MSTKERLRIAVQKNGRLSEKSLALLKRCGLDPAGGRDQLLQACGDFPLDIMLVRDDDIPHYVADGICELGIVGLNMLQESLLGRVDVERSSATILENLGFGRCRLCIAVPQGQSYAGPSDLQGKRIATSYPRTLRSFLQGEGVEATIIDLAGSVEIAPALSIADVICDLVSTGATLRASGLREAQTILESETVFIQTSKPLTDAKRHLIARLRQRVVGVSRAAVTKYVMLNAPRSALSKIREAMPGMERPTVMPLASDDDHGSPDEDMIAIHAVARESDFWGAMERLKAAGASSILVTPIEKIIA